MSKSPRPKNPDGGTRMLLDANVSCETVKLAFGLQFPSEPIEFFLSLLDEIEEF
jgi:hypothetical protein